ncbi:MAG: DUF1513 domain-containing protein [Abyssibacter sp.]|uniref:DUF1513 domain-containing protein n=1 Tax=Abyssibacter sp. TaxID=2320200 RepID=UPI00321A36B9
MTVAPEAAPASRPRRRLLGAIASLGLVTVGGVAWVQRHPQAPRLVSAVRKPSGGYAIVALSGDGQLDWSFDLPHRGHSVLPSPDGRLLAAFPRRPGRTIWLLDTATGALVRRLSTDTHSQMNGHGVFDAKGRRLYVTQTRHGAVTTGEIAVYSVDSGRRLGRFASGGLDPHQCVWCGDELVIAHGGYIEYPARNQPKQLDPARPPNLAWVDAGAGRVRRIDQLTDPKLSIRHLAADARGVFAGFQHDDGAGAQAALLGYASPTLALKPLDASRDTWAAFNGYVGSVALDVAGGTVIATSPRGGVLGLWGRESLDFYGLQRMADVCGAAAGPQGWVATTGFGVVADAQARSVRTDYAFDNHLAMIGA